MAQQGRILVAQGNKWTAKPILLTTQGRIQVKEGRLLYFPKGRIFVTQGKI